MLRLALILFVPAVASAQSTTFLRIAVGPEQAAQSNPAATDYRYAGWGSAFTLGWGRERPASALDFSAGISITGLHSQVTGAKATDWRAGLGGRYVRSLGRAREIDWMLGLDVTATVDVAQYTFNSRLSTTDEFGYFLLSLAPVLRAHRPFRSGRLTNDLAFVAVGWIDSPYANARMNGSSLRLNLTGPPALIAAEEALTYCIACDRSRSVAWTYRLSYLAYSALDTRRFARHSLAMTFNLPVRRSP